MNSNLEKMLLKKYTYVDADNNIIPQIRTEQHQIDPVSCSITLKEEPSPTPYLKIKKIMTGFNDNDNITNFTITDSEPTKADEAWFDSVNKRVVFFDTQAGKNVQVSYLSTGYNLISSDMVYLTHDSNGEVGQSLTDLFVKCQQALYRVQTIGNLSAEIEQGKILLSNIMELITLVPNGNTVLNELKEVYANSLTVESQLNTLLNALGDIDEQINSTNNKSIIISSTNFTQTTDSDGFVWYTYTWNHGLASKDLVFNAYEIDANGNENSAMCAYQNIDNNNTLVKTNRQIRTKIVANARTYKGV